MHAIVRIAVAVGLLAMTLGAQRARAEQAIADAESARTAGDDERAAMILHDGWRAIDAIPDRRESDLLRRQMRALLSKVDPLFTRLERARKKAAETLLRAARADAKKDWLATAEILLESAAAIAPAVAAEELAEVSAARRGGDADGRPPTATWFAGFDNPTGEGGWRLDSGELWSPRLSGLTVYVFGKKTLPADYTVHVDVRLPVLDYRGRDDEPATKAAVLFGVKSVDEYDVLELRHLKGVSELRLLHYEEQNMAGVGSTWVTLTHAERRGWIPLRLRCHAGRIEASVGDLARIEVAGRGDLSGPIGAFVSGDTKDLSPVGFRVIRVEEN